MYATENAVNSVFATRNVAHPYNYSTPIYLTRLYLLSKQLIKCIAVLSLPPPFPFLPVSPPPCGINVLRNVIFMTTHLLQSWDLPTTNIPSSLKYNPVILGSANVEMNPPRAWKAAIRTWSEETNSFRYNAGIFIGSQLIPKKKKKLG